MRTLILAAAVVMSLTTYLQADDKELSAYAKAARDFSFEGTKMGTSLADFKKKHPDAIDQSTYSDSKVGAVCLGAVADAASACSYSFFDDKLYQVQIHYEAKDVARIGGKAVLINRLMDKFGPNPVTIKEKEKDVFGWVLHDVNRAVTLIDRPNGTVSLGVTDTKLDSEVMAKKAKSGKTGFDE
jgi:hypothetical protein